MEKQTYPKDITVFRLARFTLNTSGNIDNGSEVIMIDMPNGTNTLAAEYEDPNKVLPEIWLKGTRNAYTLYLDPIRRWAFYGEISPDFRGKTDEFSLYTNPAFAVWPYWAGNNVVNTHIDVNLRETDPSNPI